MKKIILGIVFVFATVSFTNAKNEVKNDKPSSVEYVAPDCFSAAWDYGTANGNGDEYWTWYYTNQYYSAHCA